MFSNNISIIGAGWIGMVSGLCFAKKYNINFVDIDENKINMLSKGNLTIYEPSLKELLQQYIKEEKLSFSTNINTVVNSKFIFICINTPSNSETGETNLTYINSAIDALENILVERQILIIKSTVPVGFSTQVNIKLKNKNVTVLHNPEFLRESTAIKDFLNPERVVIGSDEKDFSEAKELELLYQNTVENSGKYRTIYMSRESSELCKYAANTFLLTKLSYMNEIANLCEHLNADFDEVKQGFCSDKRIGFHFTNVAAKAGGPCLVKDASSLIYQASNSNYDFRTLKAAFEINKDNYKVTIINKILSYYDDNLENKTFTILGTTFKPFTDDILESIGLEVIKHLLKHNCRINIHDPKGLDKTKQYFNKYLIDNKLIAKKQALNYYNSSYPAMYESDGLILCTEWNEYKTINLKIVSSKVKNKVIFDGKNILKNAKKALSDAGFDYFYIG